MVLDVLSEASSGRLSRQLAYFILGSLTAPPGITVPDCTRLLAASGVSPSDSVRGQTRRAHPSDNVQLLSSVRRHGG